MAKVRVRLLRPVMSREIGSEVEYDKADAIRLAGYGAVEILGDVEEKAEPAPENKAEGPSPDNKSEAAAPASKAPARKASKGR